MEIMEPSPSVLCIVCCCAYDRIKRENFEPDTPSSEGETGGNWKISSLLNELDLEGPKWYNLVQDSVCWNCLNKFEWTVTERRAVEEIEGQILELQMSLLTSLKDLQLKLGKLHKQLSSVADLMDNADVPCLMRWIQSRRYNTDAIVFRERFFRVANKLAGFQQDLSGKLLLLPRPPVETKKQDKTPNEAIKSKGSRSPKKDEKRKRTRPVKQEINYHEDTNNDINDTNDDDQWIPEESPESDDNIDNNDPSHESISEHSQDGSKDQIPRKRGRKSKKVFTDYDHMLHKLPAWKGRIVRGVLRKAENPYHTRDKDKNCSQESRDSKNALMQSLPKYSAFYNSESDSLTYGDIPIHLDLQTRTITCGQCSMVHQDTAKVVDLLVRHIYSEHLNGLSCPECSKVCKGYNAMRHLSHHFFAVHKSVASHNCHICGKTLKTKCSLEQHLITHFGEDEKAAYYKKSGVTPKKEMVETDERPFQCDKCPLTFKKNRTLINHQIVHMENREKVMCNQCGSLMLKKSLPGHLADRCAQMDQERPPIQCTKCTKSFRNMRLLKLHLRNSHAEARNCRNFKCSICPDTHPGFKSLSYLNSHMLHHNNIRKHNCSKKCGCAFSTRKSLLRHERSCRGIPAEERKHPGRPSKLAIL